MRIIKKKVFEKNIEIVFEYENQKIFNSVAEQFSYYDDVAGSESIDLSIKVCRDFNHHSILQRNPSIHSEIKNGFIIDYKTHRTAFYKSGEKLNADLLIKVAEGLASKALRKLNNIEYATREERAAGIIFETILIPSLFFYDDKAVIHSAGFAIDGKAVLIGGSGGGGKTSLEIELCQNKNYTFLNDDIAVVSKSAEVLPNLNHPKIYAYNLKGNEKLREKIIDNKPFADRMQWELKTKLFGPSKVRRRLSIKNYQYTNKNVPLEKYFILSKENVSEINLDKISSEDAAKISVNIILTEYAQFFNHILWHEFNSISKGKSPIITFDEIKNRQEKAAKNVLQKTNNYVLRIPLEIDHREFISEASEKIMEAN